MTFNPYQSLFLSRKFSDVAFVLDNKSIPAHKIILASNCPYFKTMLFGETKESNMAPIELKNVSYNIFVEVLRFLYLQKVDISDWTPKEVKKLILIADEYLIPEMGCAIAQAVKMDTQTTIHDMDDVFSAAKRLKCIQLMKKCKDLVQMKSEAIIQNKYAFNELSMDLILHLIEEKILNPADTRLVYLIGNWRKSASIEDKKVLLSKIDWKSLPGKYSEPLVRMFLENDAKGLQVKDWTSGLNGVDAADLIAGLYVTQTNNFYSKGDAIKTVLRSMDGVINNQSEMACVVFFFRECVTNLKRIRFNYSGMAEILLKIYGAMGKPEISGACVGQKWQFDLSSNIAFSSVVLQISNKGFRDVNYDLHATHSIKNLRFFCTY